MNKILIFIFTLSLVTQNLEAKNGLNYKVVDTNQVKFFNNTTEIPKPSKESNFYGQDANFIKNTPSYTENKDNTITDNITGLVWQKSYKVLTYSDSLKELEKLNKTTSDNWRLPSIKELYSLMDFSGKDASARDTTKVPANAKPYIDNDYFDFDYGSNGERVIDVQLLSSTIYKGTTMGENKTAFGLNIADGRIKGYPISTNRGEKTYSVRFVRGNEMYGINDFVDNSDSTITDSATGLMWSKEDNGSGMNWEEALAWVKKKNSENYLGYSDWKLPDAKELHSIVDYSNSPQSNDSPAINSIFNISKIEVEEGLIDYPFYWTSTTHESIRGGNAAVYIAFGEALGYWGTPRSKKKELIDVHGAGAQRSDPKAGNASKYPEGRGPQGDVIRINNYIRLVRNTN